MLSVLCLLSAVAEFSVLCYQVSQHFLFPVIRCLSKWFYDTSPGTTTRAACGGSLIGGTKALNTQCVSYEGTRWTRGFTWFGPPERNTLCPRENESYCIVVYCSSLGLNLP
jgi:hypothetical protein